MTDKYLSPEDREARDNALDAALAGGRVDDEAIDRAETLITDAEQARLSWARITVRSLVRSGLRRLLNQRSKAESVVLMPYQGGAATTTMRVGVRRRSDDGRLASQLLLFSEMSWTEVEAFLAMIETHIAAGMVNRAKAGRLLELREQFPDTFGPAEACARLGTTVGEYLEREA